MCFCFPGEATVTTKRGVKRLDELKPGDEILTVSRKSGVPKWTLFYAWGHRETSAVAEFLIISLSNGMQLKITKDHLLFVAGEGGKKVAKAAGQVCKGDKLFHLGTSNGALELSSVVEISAELLTGIYAPFTMSGHFLANGFLVGCYANVEDFELAHAVLAPLRAWYKIRPSKDDEGQKEGIHGYTRQLMKFREALPTPLRNRVQ